MSRKKPIQYSDPNLHPRVIISGYYGFDNLGDELILRVLTDELKARDIRITVLSNRPEQTKAEYDVDAIHRMNFIDIVDALSQSNLFISGGGGLFQDATGPMSSLYYGGLIHLARFFEVPVCFWAQGVGPLKTSLARKLTASALQQCEKIAVRDEASAELVDELIGEYPDVTADPVWLLNVPKSEKTSKRTRKKSSKKSAKEEEKPWRIGISLRPWPQLTDKRLEALADCMKTLVMGTTRPIEFRLLPFQAHEDRPLLERLAGYLEAPPNITPDAAPDAIPNTSWHMADPANLIAAIGECDLLFGMRFHSLILAILQDVAVYGLVYDPKVKALLETFELKGVPIEEMEGLNAGDVQDYFNAYPVINLRPLKKQAKRNFDLLHKMLAIPEAELVL